MNVDELFPDRPRGYFDTASIGLVPEAVRDAVGRCYDALSLGTRGSARWRPVVERAARVYAGEFGAAESEVSFMASTGEAINAIARAITWRPGDEVVAFADEFSTVVLPWQGLGGQVRLVRITPPEDDDRTAALLAAIGPRTRVVSVAHVNSSTGTRVDLAAIGAACRRVGARLVTDGAQSAGSGPLDLSGTDFYIATAYKWLVAGFGCAVVVARQEAMDELEPGLLGHSNVPPARRLVYGHANLPGIHALDAAAAVRGQVGAEAIGERVAALALRIHGEAAELGLRPVAAPSRTAGIVSFAVPDATAAVGALATRGITAAARGGHLRVSPHFYTSDAEVDDLLRALKELNEGDLSA